MSKSLEQIVTERETAWTVDELAVTFNYSTKAIYKMVAEKRLKPMRLGSTLRFCPRTIEAWVTGKAA